MSRVGKLPVSLPDKVSAGLAGQTLTVSGPLGNLNFTFRPEIELKLEEKSITVIPVSSNSQTKALWGTTRAIISNMVTGVSTGFKKSLELNGVGFKFEVAGTKLILSVGFSHKVEMEVPTGLKVVLDEKLKNTIYISGIDKHLVGEFASNVRSIKKPEPYKGKGIKYIDETIRRKAGKTGKKK